MNKTKIIVGVLVLVATFGAGYFATPTKVKTETKEVIKTVTVKEEAKTKVVYKERIVYKDGTIVEREGEKETSDTKEGSSTESSKSASTDKTKDSGLTLSALTIVDSSEITGHRDYGIHVTKRALGNINIGAIATTDKKIGLSVGLSF